MAGGKKLRVVGAAVVLRSADNSERYLYRDAVVASEGFTPESVKRAIDNGLVEEFEAAAADDEGDKADEAPSKSWNHARLDAWAAAHEPVIEFVNEDPSKPLTKEQKLEQIAAAVASGSGS